MANKQEKIKVRFCPKCKSFEVGYVFGLSSWLGMSPKMRCKKCKFEMPSFPILTIDKNDLEKSVRKKKSSSTSSQARRAGGKSAKTSSSRARVTNENKLKRKKK